MFTIIFVAKCLKGFGWNNVGPASQTVAQHYFIIYPMYRVIRRRKRHPYGSQSKHGTITQFSFIVGPASNTTDLHWPSNGLRRWPNIEPVLVRYIVLHECCSANTKHCITFVQRRPSVFAVGPPLYKCYTNVLYLLSWPAPAMVVEGIGLHVEDTLVSLVLSIIISWTFRILANEENQYTVMFTKYLAIFLSNALKQTKAGPRSSGTPFLVSHKLIHQFPACWCQTPPHLNIYPFPFKGAGVWDTSLAPLETHSRQWTVTGWTITRHIAPCGDRSKIFEMQIFKIDHSEHLKVETAHRQCDSHFSNMHSFFGKE